MSRLRYAAIGYLFAALSCNADPFDSLRVKWRGLLTGGDHVDASIPEIREQLSAIEERARRTWREMKPEPNSEALWNDLASTTSSSQITSAWSRLRSMALAWSTPGQKLYGDGALLTGIRQGCAWMEQHRYNARIAREYANWWDWEIGSPLAVDDLLVLLYEQLTPEEIAKYAAAVDRFVPDPRLLRGSTPSTGANRVWKCQGAALRAIVVKDAAKLQMASEGLLAVFPYVTSGDGFYEDGSFIQHSRHPYTGGYGNSLLTDTAGLLYLLAGSAWDVHDPARAHLYRWVFESFEPLLYRGAMMDMVRGREASRSGTTDHASGHTTLRAILRISQFAPAAEARRMRSMVKEVLLSDAAMAWSAGATIEQSMAIHSLLADRGVERRGDLRGSWIFGSMDRIAHQRGRWAFGIATHSTRIFNFESINGENLHGGHTGDGMTYLYTPDVTQFSDGFWTTVDPERLPGTTVVAGVVPGPGSRANRLNGSAIAGGVSVEGKASVMMLLAPEGGKVEAKKSWFLLDDEVVAMGAGIRSREEGTVETIVENRMSRDSAPYAVAADGKWAFVEGAAGYYFPNGAGWKTAEAERHGAWKDINEGGSTAAITRRYRTIWFEHGVKPESGSYAYALLPGKTREEVRGFAAAPDFEIVENSEKAQSVRFAAAGVRAANFWSDASYRSGGVTSDSVAAVLVVERGVAITVGVADPSQLNTKRIHLTLDRAAARVIEKDASIVVEQLEPVVRIAVDVKDARGRTQTARFALK